jgi:hypothetical protein
LPQQGPGMKAASSLFRSLPASDARAGPDQLAGDQV